MGEDLWVDGFFGIETREAVERFQLEYKEEVLRPWVEAGIHNDENIPTGYVFETTRRWINLIMCPELGLSMPDLSIYFRETIADEIADIDFSDEQLLIDDESEELEVRPEDFSDFEEEDEESGDVDDEEEDQDIEVLAGTVTGSGPVNITRILAGVLALVSLSYIGYRGFLYLKKRSALESWSG